MENIIKVTINDSRILNNITTVGQVYQISYNPSQ